MTIGERIKHYRLQKQMTQEKIEKANSYTEWVEASLNHIWAYDDNDVNDTERISLILGMAAAIPITNLLG